MKCSRCHRDIWGEWRSLSGGGVCLACFQKTAFGRYCMILEDLLGCAVWDYVTPRNGGVVIELVLPRFCQMQEVNPFRFGSLVRSLRGMVDRRFPQEWKYRILDATAYEQDSGMCGVLVDILARDWNEDREEDARGFLSLVLRVLAPVYAQVYPEVAERLREFQEELKREGQGTTAVVLEESGEEGTNDSRGI